MSRRPGLGDVTGEKFPTTSLISREMLIDSGLPTVVFVTIYALNGQVLQPALFAALGAGALLAVLRLARRDSIQNVVGGFVAVGVAAWFANRTGQAEDFFAPGLLINVAYGLAYLVSILVRWPLLGVLVALATGEGMGWRATPHLLRAYTVASWFWVAMFALRLAVQLPLYLTESVVALGVARVVMGWPLFLLCLWLSWLVIKGARDRQAAIEAAQADDEQQQSSADQSSPDEPEAR
ncbi:MAG: DUF3159 domain-containing protein [Jiangellales bacterium]